MQNRSRKSPLAIWNRSRLRSKRLFRATVWRQGAPRNPLHLYLSNTSVPIKIAPPQGMAAASFMVKLERRDNQGNWGIVTNLPVSVAEATSQAGNIGWGAPGNGRDPSRMVSLPGTYRISAQVAYPRQTGWSPPIEFVVTTPNKASQKAPKMFGP